MPKKNKRKNKINVWKSVSFYLVLFLFLSIIVNMLMPKDIDYAIRKLQSIRQENLPQEAQKHIENAITQLEKAKSEINDSLHVKGILVEEFSEFDCVECKKVFYELRKIRNEYSNNITFIYRHFPINAASKKTAEAAECAKDQGRFWEYHDKLYANQALLGVDDLKRYASDLSLDILKFNDCLDKSIKENYVKSDFEKGKKRGIKSGPVLFIAGKKFAGNLTYEDIRVLIINATV